MAWAPERLFAEAPRSSPPAGMPLPRGSLVEELFAGDLVPADLRLPRSNDMAVNQAVFTG